MPRDSVPAELRRIVVERAANRCEYCGLAQEGQEATFHVDHIIPRFTGGPTVVDNLALACVTCSLSKGARVTAVDPITGEAVTLFNPRRHRFREHYRYLEPELIPMTAIGRATVFALRINAPARLIARGAQAVLGRYPPPSDWPA
jgi:hypothetical protein